MGLCLSCLVAEVDDNESDERTSLLGESRSGDEDFQNELLRQQQRQNELSLIVNDLSENLIDVSAFLGSNGGQNHSALSQSIDNLAGEDDSEQGSAALPSAGLENREKQYPKVWTVEEKSQLLLELAKKDYKCELSAPKDTLFVDL